MAFGTPEWDITPERLLKVEQLGASGLKQRWAAQALGINENTFTKKKTVSREFLEAWERGRQAFADKMMEAMPKVFGGLVKNATEMAIDGKTGNKTGTPGGDVKAQELLLKHLASGFQDKAAEAAKLGTLNVGVQIILPDNGRKAIVEADEPKRIGDGQAD